MRVLSLLAAVLLLAGCHGTGSSGTTPPDSLEPVDPDLVPGAEDPSEIIFDPESIPEFHLELDEDAIDALDDEPYEYTEGSFTYDGREFGPIGVRLKGENSFLGIHEKPSFKLKFDVYVDGGEFLGLEELTLNNMASDMTMMHERLCYQVFREADVPASRAHHARVFVNDDFYGLYVNVETVDRRLIRRWFEDDGGTLFEGWDVDFYPEYVDAFQLEFGEEDRSAIAGLAEALEMEDADEALEAAEEFVDLEAFGHFWAVTAVTGQFDAYPYHPDDFHLYHDPTSGVLHFLPWGTDESFLGGYSVGWIMGRLAIRCTESPSCLEDWAWDVWDTLDRVEEMDWLAEFDRIDEQIADSVAEDDRKPYGGVIVAMAQADMREFMEIRRETIMEDFGLR